MANLAGIGAPFDPIALSGIGSGLLAPLSVAVGIEFRCEGCMGDFGKLFS